jgi:hypothetical protein
VAELLDAGLVMVELVEVDGSRAMLKPEGLSRKWPPEKIRCEIRRGEFASLRILCLARSSSSSCSAISRGEHAPMHPPDQR